MKLNETAKNGSDQAYYADLYAKHGLTEAIYTRKELKSFLKLTDPTLNAIRRKGFLKQLPLQAKLKVPRAEVCRYLEAAEIPVTVELETKAEVAA